MRATAIRVPTRRRRRRHSGGGLGTTAALIGVCIVIVLPFLWLVVTSLKYPRDIVRPAHAFHPTLYNYRALFVSGTNFARIFLNTTIVAAAATIGVLVIGGLCGYSLVRGNWGGAVHKIIGLFNGWLLIIPPVALVGGFFFVISSLHLDNTLWSLIIGNTALQLPVGVWVMRDAFAALPPELEEAARIDGASGATIFWRVMLPLTRPAIATVTILAFVFSWNQFLLPLVVSSTSSSETVPVVAASFINPFQIEYGNVAAAAVLAALPAVIAVVVAQRWLTAGLTRGAVKA